MINPFSKEHIPHSKNLTIDTDLYIKVESKHDLQLPLFLKGAVDLFQCSTGQTCPKIDMGNKWLYTEITEDPINLVRKAWQLERSCNLLGTKDVAALMILTLFDHTADLLTTSSPSTFVGLLLATSTQSASSWWCQHH